jgi:hypothetical protein
MLRSPSNILLFGTGSLARSICYSLAATALGSCLHVRIASRSVSQLQEIEAISNIRARLLNNEIRFTSSRVNWDDETSLAELMQEFKPKIVLHAASVQSPWELSRKDCRWAILVAKSGFGLTLPLQAVLAIKVARALQTVAPPPLFLNACYPDAINPLLRALGFNVLCGVGNIAILAAMYEASNPPGWFFHMLAHHYHIGAMGVEGFRIDEGPRLWHEGKSVHDTDQGWIRTLRAIHGRELNHVTGCTVAVLIGNITMNREFRSHVPGPFGLPGGYPVLFRDGALKLDLPPQVTESQAIDWNQTDAMKDGVVVSLDGTVQFSLRASRNLAEISREIPTSFPASEIVSIGEQFLLLKERLLAS